MQTRNFQNRVLGLALLPGILAALVLGAFFSIERSKSLNHMLDDRALTIAKHFAPSCKQAVISSNYDRLQSIAINMLEERDMRSISILDQNMHELAHAGPKFSNFSKVNYELHNEQLFLLRTKNTVRARAPIIDLASSDIVGWVEIELANTNTRLLRYQYILMVFSVIASVLGIFGFIIVRLSSKLALSFQQLLKAIKELEDGQLETRVPLNSRDEFSALATGINAMASALQRSQTEYQQNLDQATRDLRETLDEMEIRNSELQIGRREALEANIMKSEFLANVSHEIRTPLNGILGFSELMARTDLSDQQIEYLSTIHKSSENLLKILNDILDLSKIDAGKLIVERIYLNLRDILEEVVIMLAPEAYSKDIELNYLIYSDVPLNINSDPLRLKQVLINLASNAIKFTHQGSVNIRISTVSKSDNHASIQFEIQDTGIGINDTQLSKLFTPFSQAESSTARRFGGTGLGLVISKALVEAMGGEMQVTSQLGKGSTFSFHIDAEINTTETTNFPPLTNSKAALVDASMISRLNTSGVLTEWQIEHNDFETPQQLLEHHQLNHPGWQVILYAMEDKLPEDKQLKSNIETLTTLGLPIIASTGILNNAHIEDYKKLGVTHVLTHPCTRKNFYGLLRLALNLESIEDHGTNEALVTTPPTVLAVDDNQANLQLVITLLKELNIPTLSASNGQDAIDIIKQQPVDLVLMDIQMPVLNGLEATKIIRTLDNNSDVPVIALTAHAMADEKEALLKAGINDYQTKPINQEKLSHCIERWTGYRVKVAKPKALEQLNVSRLRDGVFDASLALRNSNQNASLAAELFTMLLESLAKDTQLIIEAWEDEAFVELLELVHKLHGATRYCGVPKLTYALEQLEVALKTEESSQQWPNLLRAFVEQSAALQHWASSNDWLVELNL